MPKLTKSLIDSAQPAEKTYLLWDSAISGFGVKITPTGRKVYLMKFRTADGRQKKPSIGVHGNITCERAREIAREWHGELAKGNDPSENRQSLRQSPTVSQLCDRFMRDHVRIHKKASSAELDEFFIEKYIKPNLGTLKTISVNRQDINRFHISHSKTPSQANRMLAALSKMFNLAEEWGLRPAHSNPTHGVQKYKEEKRERFLSEEEMKTLGETLETAEKEGTETPHFVALIRLLMLTGARLSEIKNAKWEWVDEQAGLLRLPDSKTGKKVIHLSPAALEVLKGIPRLDDNPHIIAGGKPGMPLHNAQKPWRRVRKKAGLEDVRLHDLRHTYASACIGQGMPLAMVAKLLGHAQLRTTERYAHLANDPVKAAAAQSSEFIGKHFMNREEAIDA